MQNVIHGEILWAKKWIFHIAVDEKVKITWWSFNLCQKGMHMAKKIFDRITLHNFYPSQQTGSSKTNAQVIILCQAFTADGVYLVSEWAVHKAPFNF